MRTYGKRLQVIFRNSRTIVPVLFNSLMFIRKVTLWEGLNNRWDIRAHRHLQPLSEMYVRFCYLWDGSSLAALILLAVPEEEREQFSAEIDIENIARSGTAEGSEGGDCPC